MRRFSKYSGCGNDFILIDQSSFMDTDFSNMARRYCPRRHGIGADGLIVIAPSCKADFKFSIYNADGSEAEMCGNGLRSAVHYFLKGSGDALVETKERILRGKAQQDEVLVEMGDVSEICEKNILIDGNLLSLTTLNTGVPHAVLFVENLDDFDVFGIGRLIRYHQDFSPHGTNFNACKITKEGLEVRTYERGVEDETLACGTGATAASIAAALRYNIPAPIKVTVRSRDFLTIDFQIQENKPKHVTMLGRCVEVFKGFIP